MRPLRLVLVTRRFWPLVGGAERVMGCLAAGLVGRGSPVVLLTARWHPDWPARITYRGAPVLRLAQPSLRYWGTVCYMRGLSRWLRTHRGQYDLVCVSMLKHDAYAVLRAVRGRVPVVLRAEGGGQSGDCAWQQTARCGTRIRRQCRRAGAIVAPSLAIRQELLQAGYPAERVHRMANGVPIPAHQPGTRRAEARNALAAANPELALPSGAVLGVYVGRLDRAKGIFELVGAWRRVLDQWPHARLWLAGDGPDAQALAGQIASQGLGARVVLAGMFDNVDDLLAAADLFVLPSWEEGMSLALLEAMAAGLPIVATDIPGNREVVTDGQHALLVPPREPDALASAIRRLLGDRPLADRLAHASQALARQQYSVDRMVEGHMALFRQLVSGAANGVNM